MSATIYLDSYEIPHILGDRDTDVCAAHGFLQMRQAPRSMLLSVAFSKGWRTRCLGRAPGNPPPQQDPWFREDRLARLLEHTARGREFEATCPPRLRQWMKAFHRGALEARDRYRDALKEMMTDGDGSLSPDQADALLSMPIRSSDWFAIDHRVASLYELDRLRGQEGPPRSSNAIAVSASRSSNKSAMLLVDPHIPFDLVPELRLQLVHLRGPTIRAAGLVRPGSPLPTLGWMGSIALAITSNWPTTCWLVRCPVRRNASGKRQARFRQRWRAVRSHELRLPVLGARDLRTRTEFVDGRPVWKKRGRYVWVAVMATHRGGRLTEQAYQILRETNPDHALKKGLRVDGHPSLNYIEARESGVVRATWNARIPGGFEHMGGTLYADESQLDPSPIKVRRDSRFFQVAPKKGQILLNNNASPDAQHLHTAPDSKRLENAPASLVTAPQTLTSFRHLITKAHLEATPGRIGRTLLESLAVNDEHLRAQALLHFLKQAKVTASFKPSLFRHWNGRADKDCRHTALLEIWWQVAKQKIGIQLEHLERPELWPEITHTRFGDRTILHAIASCFREAHELWIRWGKPRWGSLHGQWVLGPQSRKWVELGGTGSCNRALESTVPWTKPTNSPPKWEIVHGQVSPMIITMAKSPKIHVMQARPNAECGARQDLQEAWQRGQFTPLEIRTRKIETGGRPWRKIEESQGAFVEWAFEKVAKPSRLYEARLLT